MMLMNSKKKTALFLGGALLLLSCFLGIPQIQGAEEKKKLIEFYDGSVYTESKTRFSVNSNFPNMALTIFQQLELKFRANFSDSFDMDGLFKTEYSLFNKARDTRRLFINSLTAYFHIRFNLSLKLGSLFLNYSPYLLINYPWEKDIFRGCEVKYSAAGWDLQAFAANNGVDPAESELFDAVPSINLNVNRDYSTIDLGYSDPSTHNEKSTWWYGGQIAYKAPNSFSLPFSIRCIFLNEQLQNTALFDNASRVFDNKYIFSELNFNIMEYAKPDLLACVCFSHVDSYAIQSNYYGTSKNLFSRTGTTNYLPLAFKAGFQIPNLLVTKIENFRTALDIAYDRLDQRYTPVYLDNQFQIRRSFDPDINVYSGHEGILAVVRQYFFRKTSLGYGYKQYKFSFNEMVPSLQNGTLQEHQIRFEEEYFKFFKIKAIYQIQEAVDASFPGGVKNLNAAYVKVYGNILGSILLEVETAWNLNYYKGFNQLAVKMTIWGF